MDQLKTVHITSQGKGGVFKSGAAALLTQYLRDRGHAAHAYDTDPTNATLTAFAALAATHVDVTDGNNRVDIRKFNAMVDVMSAGDGPFVVDTGATIFFSFWDYVAQTNLIEFFAGHGRRVIIHVPVMGGQELTETLKGLNSMAKMMPNASIVVWLNSFHGPVVADGKTFEEFRVAQEHAAKILGVVRLDYAMGSMRALALAGLSQTNQTFAEAMAGATLMDKHILHTVRGAIWDQLDKAMAS